MPVELKWAKQIVATQGPIFQPTNPKSDKLLVLRYSGIPKHIPLTAIFFCIRFVDQTTHITKNKYAGIIATDGHRSYSCKRAGYESTSTLFSRVRWESNRI